MAYTWNGDYMWDAATMPAAVSRYLKLAGHTQLLVLLWIASVGRGRGDAEACAADLGGRISVADCEDALRYWEQEGLLVRAGGAPAAKSVPTPEKKPEPSPARRSAVTVAPVRTATVTPAAPAAPVVQRQRDADFRFLLEAAETRLGKALSHADQNRLLDLYDTTTLPVEVVLMVIAYAVKLDKPKISYIQAVVRSWEEQNIRTVEAADQHLCYLERLEQSIEQLEQILDISLPRPTLSQKELAEKWICQWSVSRELLRLAYDRCFEKTGKFQASYMDRLLDSWRQDGLDTPEKVQSAARSRHPSKTASAASVQTGGLDLGQYAAMVQTHKPKYRKKD